MATVRELIGQLQILIGLQGSSKAAADVQRLDALLQRAQEKAKLVPKHLGAIRLPQNLGHFARFVAGFTSTRELQNAEKQFSKLTSILGEPETAEQMRAQVAVLERYRDVLESLSPKHAQAIGEARKQLRAMRAIFAVEGEMPEHLKQVEQSWRSVADQAGRSREVLARVATGISAVGTASSKNVLQASAEFGKLQERVLNLSELWDNVKASTRGLTVSTQFQRQLDVGSERLNQLLAQTDRLDAVLRELGREGVAPERRAALTKEFTSGLAAAKVLVRDLGISFAEVGRQANIALRAIPGAGAREIEFTARELKALAAKFKPGMLLTEIKADSQARASALQKINMLTARQRKELERAVMQTKALLEHEKLYKMLKVASNLELAKQNTLLGRIEAIGRPILNFFSRWHQAIDDLAFRTFTIFITYMNFRQLLNIVRGFVDAWLGASKAIASLTAQGFPEARRQAEQLAQTMGVSLQTAAEALDAASLALRGAGLRMAEVEALAPRLAQAANELSLALQVSVPEAAGIIQQAMQGNWQAIQRITGLEARQAQRIAQMSERTRARRIVTLVEQRAQELPKDRTFKEMRDAAEAIQQFRIEMGQLLAIFAQAVTPVVKVVTWLLRLPVIKEAISLMLTAATAILGLSLPFLALRVFFQSLLWQGIKNTVIWLTWAVLRFKQLKTAMSAMQAVGIVAGGVAWIPKLIGAFKWISKLVGAFKVLGAVVAGIAAAIGAPFWAVAAAIAAVIGLVTHLAIKFKWLDGIMKAVWGVIKPIVDFFGGVFGAIGSALFGVPAMAATVPQPTLATAAATPMLRPALAVTGAAPAPVAALSSTTVAPSLSFYVNVNIQGVTDVEKAREQAPLLARDIWVQVLPHLDRYFLQVLRGEQEHRPADERWRRP